MTLAEIADLAEIIGAFGVIAGLIFVGMQMRQNTLQLRRAETNVTNAEASAIRQALFGDAEFAELISACVRETRELSPVETDRVHAFLWEIVFQTIQFWDRTKHGLFPPGEFERLAPSYAPYLCCSIGRAWWHDVRRFFRSDFVTDVERVIPGMTSAASPVGAAS